MANVQEQLATPSGMPDLSSGSVSGQRNLVGTVLTILSGVCTAVVVIPLFVVLWDVVRRGLPLFSVELFTQLPRPRG